MTAIPPPTLAVLAYHWGDAYLLSSVRDRWVALRRDGRYFLVTDTLAGLETAIVADYEANPVFRDYDPPGTPEEMSWPPIPGLPCPGDRDDAGKATEAALNVYLADEESLNLLLLLRRTFPQWDISYAPAIQAWIARRHSSQTLCENSPALLAIALTLIERRERQHAAPAGARRRGKTAAGINAAGLRAGRPAPRGAGLWEQDQPVRHHALTRRMQAARQRGAHRRSAART